MLVFVTFEDTDECALGIDKCPVSAICSNTDGGYDCLCKDGYVSAGPYSCIGECVM